MITNFMRQNILTYKDALVYIISAYNAKGYKRDNFTVALKDMYDLMIEKERKNMALEERRARARIGEEIF